MTPEQQRIAIAEVCGWKNVDAGAGRVWGFTTRHKGTPSESDVCVDVPDYLNDLNAMHEVETILNADQMVSYDYHLDRVVGNGRQGLNIEYFLWSATASQRAEAFLRTIGKWEDAK